MNPFTSVLFPDTDIFKDNRYPLMLLCSPLHYLRPVEQHPDSEAGEESDLFIKNGLCQAITPPPLGRDLERFVRLVRDIRDRQDDYGAQLAALTMASMSESHGRTTDEQGYEIVTSLLKGGGVATGGSDPADLKRWQARLVLSIAEILDREEAELTQHLQQLDERELEMLRTLQGDDQADQDNPLAELERIRATLSTPRPRETKLRVRAWLTLARDAGVPPGLLWCAASRGSGDELFNRYEKQADSPASPVLKLPYPAAIPASPSHCIEQIKEFHREAAPVFEAMHADFERLRTAPYQQHADSADLLPGDHDYISAWEAMIDRHFPASSHGRAALVLYVLPNASVEELFALEAAAASDARNGLVLVCQNE